MRDTSTGVTVSAEEAADYATAILSGLYAMARTAGLPELAVLVRAAEAEARRAQRHASAPSDAGAKRKSA